MVVHKQSRDFPDARHECSSCDQTIHYKDVCQTWKCPACGESIHIKVLDEGRKIVINKKRAMDVQINDLIIISGQSEAGTILNVECYDNKVRIAIKNYGKMDWEENAFANILLGTWE